MGAWLLAGVGSLVGVVLAVGCSLCFVGANRVCRPVPGVKTLRKCARRVCGGGISVVSPVTKLTGLNLMRAALPCYGAPSRQCIWFRGETDSCPLVTVGCVTQWYRCLSPLVLRVRVVILVRSEKLLIRLVLFRSERVLVGSALSAVIPCLVRGLAVTWQATESTCSVLTSLLLVVSLVRKVDLFLFLS